MTGQPAAEGRKDFFISRAGADAVWAQWIAWQLEAAGYSVIVQDWDFAAGSNFVSNMRMALDQATTTIPLYSAAYFASPYTEDEWTAAFVHGQDGGRRLLPIRVEEVDVPRLLRPVVYVDLVGLDEEAARQRLLQAVRDQGRAKPSREPRFPGTGPPRFPPVEEDGGVPIRVVNLPPVEVTRFVDRAHEQDQLRRYLVDEPVRLVSVLGRAGVGKSALASRVLGGLGDHVWPQGAETSGPAGILYLTARGTGLSLERIFADVKRLIGEAPADRLHDYWSRLDVTLRQKVEALIESLRGRGLIILLDGVDGALAEDGAIAEDGLRMFLEVCLRQLDGPRLVVTSRADVALPPEAFPVVRAIRLQGGLGPEDAMSLLRNLDPQGDLGLRDASEQELRRASDFAHGIPRALEIVAGILRSDPAMSLEQLLADEMALGNLVVESLVAEGYHRLSLDDQRVMQALAVFDRPVSEAAIAFVVQPWFPKIDVRSSLRRLTASYFATATRATGEYALQSVDRAHAYAQIPETADAGGAEDGAISYCQATLESRAADFYASIGKPSEDWLSIEDVAPQMAEFEHRVRADEVDRALEVLELIDHNHLFLWGHYSRLIELRRKVIGKPATPRLRAANFASLAIASQVLGQYDEAATYYEEAVQIARRAGDRDAEARYVGDLGRLYRNMGLMDKAVRFSEEALGAAVERGDRRAEGVWRDRLGLAVGSMGQLSRSRALHEEAVSIAEEFGDRRSEGAALSNLGLILQLQGHAGAAEKAYVGSLKFAREIGDRRGEAIVLGRLGTVAESLEDFERAFDLHEQALVIAEALGDRREQSYQLLGLGRARMGMSQFEEAERDLVAARDLDMPETSYLASLAASLALVRRDAQLAAASFDDAIQLCDERLARCPELFAARYARATALVGSAASTDRWRDENARSSLLAPALEEYERALRNCPGPGVIAATVRDLRHLIRAGVNGLQPIIDLLERSASVVAVDSRRGDGTIMRAVLMDFGETLVERVSDQFAPLSRLPLKPFADSAAALSEIRAAGYSLAIVSNTEQSDEQEMGRALETVGLREYFDVVVTSTTVGCRKPDAAIFLRALELLGCSPQEAVMVGDDVSTDIGGAAALGMVTILVRRSGDGTALEGTQPAYIVSSLTEIVPILHELRAGNVGEPTQ